LPVVEPGPRSHSDAQQAADRLAVALEDIGFDVGRAFPMLAVDTDQSGRSGVALGRVSVPVAESLAGVLGRAAVLGLRVPGGGD
jgi:hypothetical protein